MQRFVDWGHWGITFWNGDHNVQSTWRAVCEVPFAVGAAGPIDGCLGSSLRKEYGAMCREWVKNGTLPVAAQCPTSKRWLYDETHPKARWINDQWVSAVAQGSVWIFPEGEQ